VAVGLTTRLCRLIWDGGRSLKKVQSLRIHLEDQEDDMEPHLLFDMRCEFSIVKRHRFCVEDCEIVHAVFSREGK